MKKIPTYIWLVLIIFAGVLLFINSQQKYDKVEKIMDDHNDRGVMTKLPPWSEEEPDISKLKPRNVLTVIVNSDNQLFVRDQPMEISELKALTKEFIGNPENKEEFAERPNKALVSLKNDRGTSYGTYLNVFNELKAAYNELREEKAIELYKKPFEELEREQQKEIKKMIPLVISEAEPTSFGEE